MSFENAFFKNPKINSTIYPTLALRLGVPQKILFMKNTAYLFYTVLLTLLGFQLQAQQFFFSSEKPGACATADGIVTIVPTQGVPPFTYLWSTGATDLSLKNVIKGVYTATMTDATGATVVHSHILNSKELDIHLSDQKPVTFCTPNSGALSVTTIVGVAPYTYTWSDGQTGAAPRRAWRSEYIRSRCRGRHRSGRANLR